MLQIVSKCHRLQCGHAPGRTYRLLHHEGASAGLLTEPQLPGLVTLLALREDGVYDLERLYN